MQTIFLCMCVLLLLIIKPCFCVCVFNYFQLLDVVYREETLVNVIRSVTKNGRSILLTAVLAVILIYLFSIVGFIFFRDDFMIEVDLLEPVVNKGKLDCMGNCYDNIY